MVVDTADCDCQRVGSRTQHVLSEAEQSAQLGVNVGKVLPRLQKPVENDVAFSRKIVHQLSVVPAIYSELNIAVRSSNYMFVVLNVNGFTVPHARTCKPLQNSSLHYLLRKFVL